MRCIACIAAITLAVSVMTSVRAAEVSACDPDLVKSTYNKFDTSSVDSRLAATVTNDEYDKTTHGVGLSAEIYGVPAGLNYNDFHDRASKQASMTNSSLSEAQAHALMWTGLDGDGLAAYEACLNANALSNPGLHLVIRNATQADITLIAKWVPVGAAGPVAFLTWDSVVSADLHGRLKHLTQGNYVFSVPRPIMQHALSVNTPGWGDTVQLDPLPHQPPPPVFPDVNGKWCSVGSPIPYEFYMAKSGQHVDVFAPISPGFITDVGYYGYVIQHKPSTEVPLFDSRLFISDNISKFEIIDDYATAPASGNNKYEFRRTVTSYNFLSNDVLSRTGGSSTNQSGVTSSTLLPLLTFKRCGGLPAKVFQPPNAVWKTFLPTGP